MNLTLDILDDSTATKPRSRGDEPLNVKSKGVQRFKTPLTRG